MIDIKDDIKNILVIKLRHIGDVLLSIPVFNALKETYPKSDIFALVNSGTDELLKNNPTIRKIIVFDRSLKKLKLLDRYKNELLFVKSIRDNKFDMTIDLTGGDRAAIISFLSGAKYRIGIDPNGKGFIGKRYLYTHLSNIDGSIHMVLQNLKVLERIGIKTKPRTVDIYVDKETLSFIDMLQTKYKIKDEDIIIHIHPTSRWLFKCWKDEFMAEIIKWLLEKDVRVIITSSPDKKEMEKVKKIMSMTQSNLNYKSNLIDLSGKTTLQQLASISKRADLFFGVDSAPMHIAAAVDTPVIALFGPSGAFNWGPWDNKSSSNEKVYKKRNGIQRMGKHTVIQKEWNCIPCGRDGCRGTKISKCLIDITPEIIKEEIDRKLKLSSKV